MADAVANPLTLVPELCSFTAPTGAVFSLTHTTPAEMPEPLKDWTFSLLKSNMEAL